VANPALSLQRKKREVPSLRWSKEKSAPSALEKRRGGAADEKEEKKRTFADPAAQRISRKQNWERRQGPVKGAQEGE